MRKKEKHHTTQNTREELLATAATATKEQEIPSDGTTIEVTTRCDHHHLGQMQWSGGGTSTSSTSSGSSSSGAEITHFLGHNGHNGHNHGQKRGGPAIKIAIAPWRQSTQRYCMQITRFNHAGDGDGDDDGDNQRISVMHKYRTHKCCDGHLAIDIDANTNANTDTDTDPPMIVCATCRRALTHHFVTDHLCEFTQRHKHIVTRTWPDGTQKVTDYWKLMRLTTPDGLTLLFTYDPYEFSYTTNAQDTFRGTATNTLTHDTFTFTYNGDWTDPLGMTITPI